MDDLCEIDSNTKEFYEYYKDCLNQIFDELLNIIGISEDESNDYIFSLWEKLKEKDEKKIVLEKYQLICIIETSHIYLKNITKNLELEMEYFKKIRLYRNNKLEEHWSCNEAISMLICNKDKYIYIKKNNKKNSESKDDEDSAKSIISDLSELNYEIKNDHIIFSSNKSLFKVSDLKEEFNKKIENNNIKFYLTGINACNFNSMLLDSKNVDILRSTFSLKNILINQNKNEKLKYFLYNENIGLTFELLNLMESFKGDNSPNKIFYLNIDYILKKIQKNISLII